MQFERENGAPFYTDVVQDTLLRKIIHRNFFNYKAVQEKEKQTNYQLLKDISHNEGMVLFGVADISLINKNLTIEKWQEEILQELKYALSIGYKLSSKIIDTLTDRPNRVYLFHYRTVNSLLDHTILKLASVIEKKGYKTYPIAASQIIDFKKYIGLFSHKLIGYYAGLGYIGRNNLLINKRYGATVRYATLLTNMPLKVDKPIDDDCEDCYNCIDVCPAGAIKKAKEEFNLIKCFEQLKIFTKSENLGTHYICGLCIKVCRKK